MSQLSGKIDSDVSSLLVSCSTFEFLFYIALLYKHFCNNFCLVRLFTISENNCGLCSCNGKCMSPTNTG